MDYPRQDPRKLYRERNGIFLGVCQGLATWTGLPVLTFRILATILIFTVGFFQIGAIYLLAALLLPPR